jgi:hypothetical protein
MEIIYKLVKVGKDEAMAHLKPKLNGYRKKWSQVRIGATAEPELRALQHHRDGWVRMVLLYEGLSPEIAADLERDLIDYARRCNFRTPIANAPNDLGGEGLSPQRRKNYVYLLLR